MNMNINISQLTTTTQSYQEAVGLCRDVAIERER